MKIWIRQNAFGDLWNAYVAEDRIGTISLCFCDMERLSRAEATEVKHSARYTLIR